MNRIRLTLHPLFLLSAFLSLLAAIWGGMIRIGWSWPVIQPVLISIHGPLMLSGFLGTLISLERAVALQKRWTYLAPALTALGSLVMISGGPGMIGPIFITSGSLILVGLFASILYRQRAHYTLVMAAGSLSWLAGNLLWLGGQPVFLVVRWWAGFLILTIAGERLELGRLGRLTAAGERFFLATIALIITGQTVAIISLTSGDRLLGIGYLALALWFYRFDIARVTIRKPGLPRYIAAALLAGYLWLGAAGFLFGFFSGQTTGPQYDAAVHSLFLGFTFSMIFAHAPIIFPAILGTPVRFEPVFYVQLVLLHASLLVRITGDLAVDMTLRRWGAFFNLLAILAFLGTTGFSIRRARSVPLPVSPPPQGDT